MEMAKSKGSFYHHFGDMNGYVGELLRLWGELQTTAAIERAELAPDPRAKLALLDKTVRGLDHRLDQIIRSWAMRDDRAARALAEVDQTRIDYLEKLLLAEGVPAAMANTMAELEYTAFLGAQQRFPDMETPKAKQLAAALREALKALASKNQK